MKKICFALIFTLMLGLFCGCADYTNNYSASVLITSCRGDEASMKFETFKGTYNFNLRRDGDAEHTIDYEARLTEGEMNVYVGADGEKDLLFTVKGGESFDTEVRLDSKYDDARKVYIILESVGKCTGGDFEFEYN